MGLAESNRPNADRGREKIAHVITLSQPYGGAQRNTLLTLRGLVRDGYAAELICGPGGRLIQEARTIGSQVHEVPDLDRPVHPLKDFSVLIQLYKLFRSQGYEIVHTHSTKAGLLGRLAAWWAGVPVIVHTVHGYPFEMEENLRTRFYAILERLVASMTDSIVCVGEVVRQEVTSWKMAPVQKLTTIYSGIDFSSYIATRSVSDIKRELGIETAWPIVGSVGHLVEAKAHHHLIDSMACLKHRYPQIKLLLVGDGRLRPLLERRIQDLGLSSNIALLGERDDIADLLNIFDVYAMSSLHEGVGRALTEAMYWGLPIVTTLVNGVTELIRHEETGLGVPPGDPKALAAAIDRLASDVVLAKRLGRNAKEKVIDLMDSEKMITAIEALYARLAWSKR